VTSHLDTVFVESISGNKEHCMALGRIACDRGSAGDKASATS